MERYSLEAKVGFVVVVAGVLVFAFIFILGDWNPFTNTYRFTVTLNYAGGIKPGSDVMVAGAKVGKVDLIKFHGGDLDAADDKPSVIGLELLIDKRAKELIRKDSTFAIHMESLLGGKIVEITPGTEAADAIEEGAVVRGIDPPKLDELINEGVAMLDGVKAFIDELSPEDRERFENLWLAISRIGPEDVDNLRTLIDNTADATGDLKEIAREIKPDIKPLMSDVRNALDEVGPTLTETRRLVRKIDRTITELTEYLPEDGDEAKDKVEELLEAGDDLVVIADRLERFTAMMEEEFSDVDREFIERVIREFLQQEGVTINVGKIFGEPEYPEPPPADRQSSTSIIEFEQTVYQE